MFRVFFFLGGVFKTQFPPFWYLIGLTSRVPDGTLGVAGSGRAGGGGGGRLAPREGQPGAENEYSNFVAIFCGPPLQTLVEPHFNFVCISSHLGSFFCLFPPTHPRRPHLFLVGPADHPPTPGSVWVVLYGYVLAHLEAVIALFGRVQHYHGFACRQSEVVRGRFFSLPVPRVVSVSRFEQGLRPHRVRATTALLEGWNSAPITSVAGLW